MYAIESLILRVSIVLCLVAAVVTILYFTPFPDNYAKTCDRPCQEYEWPMICRYKFTVETYLKDSDCDDCSENSTDCNNECFADEEKPRGFLVVNQQMPGPAIQVCRNDIVMVDITNKISSQSLALHFRGQLQEDSPFMDGTPMVTQCPINSYTTFQYKFRAVTPGTHYYSAHASSVTADGLFGALIVREDTRLDPNKKMFDVDDEKHLILISEWSKVLATDIMDELDVPDKILINGKPSGGDQHIFRILKGRRYRFRVIYAGGVTGCPVSLKVDNHLLKVIALDGHAIIPYEVKTIVINKGERLDFVLKAKEMPNDYFLHVTSNCFEEVTGEATVRYDGFVEKETIKRQLADGNVKNEFNSGYCQSNSDKICIGDLNAQVKMTKVLQQEEVEKQIFLSYNYLLYVQEFKDSFIRKKKLYSVNNITFTYPPSPLLTQYYDVPESLICNSLSIPPKCKRRDICECIHVEHIPLGASVELVLIDQGGDTLEHVFHLHGHHFYVVGIRQFGEAMSTEKIQSLDRAGLLFKRNLVNPPLKDTVRVPRYGAVALRFVGNNAGYWMLRDENSNLWTRGMDVVLKVGETRNFPTPPSSFPTCGSWTGPEFYLG